MLANLDIDLHEYFLWEDKSLLKHKASILCRILGVAGEVVSEGTR